MGGVGILRCDRDVRNVLLEEKVILTSKFLQEVDIFSLRPGMYGSTNVFLFSSVGCSPWVVSLYLTGTRSC